MKRLLTVCGIVAAIGCGGGMGGGAGGAGGGGGAGACVTGNERCPCFGNDTCNANLTCLSHVCVSVTGAGGSASGSAGTTGTGGTVAGAAGTVGAGGTVGAAGTTGAAGTIGAAGTVGAAGTTGAAGTIGAAGTVGAAGTTGAAGRGGTTGSAGTGGSANPNILTFTNGVITAGSNSFGITGGVYSFGDGAGSTITPNCSTDTCFGDVMGAGPFCVSGLGTRVLLNTAGTDFDYAKYWGAAVALDLNNPTNMSMMQLAYVASAHGVKGFQFTFQNRVPSSVVRLTFRVRDPGSGSLVDYCLDLAPAATSIIHFSDAKQQCYALSPGPALTAAMADHVEALQWQVPTTPAGSVAFDYCISNLMPLLQ